MPSLNQVNNIESVLDVGLACHEAGRLAEAATLYRTVLEDDPDHADALNLLGVVLQDTGDLQQSIATLSQAVAVDPKFAEAFVNLARAQNATNNPAAATCSCRQAIALDADLAEAHLQLARALLMLTNHEAAAAAARRAIALEPGSADAQLFLGHALRGLNDYPAAEVAFRVADQLCPNRYEILLNLGMVLADLKQAHNAVSYCRRAVELQPRNAQAHAALGVALRRGEDITGSVEAFGQALALAPEDPAIWRQQGDNLSLLGRFDEAAECYYRVLALDPGSSEALSCLATIGRLTNPTSERARLQATLSDPGRPEIERLTAGFALGKVFDATGDYDAAFAAYAAANRLAQAASLTAAAGFTRADFRGRINQLRAAFGRDAFEATAGWGDPSDVPVFIVGMPRSGSTLIEQILASHPDVHGGGERKDLHEITQRLEADQTDLVPANWDTAVVGLEARAQCERWRGLGGTSRRVVDKLLDNIMLLGHIAVLFPNARVIFSRRDLRDLSLSCYFQSFRDGVDWAFDLADCAERACEIERLTAHWRAVLPLRMLEVEYEKLVGDLEGESRRMIDFLGLDWNDACLRFQDTERFIQTASFWQARQPIYASSVGRWRHYRAHLQPLLAGLVGMAPVEIADVATANILAGASAHLEAGRNDAAAFAYQMLLEREPENTEALYALGRLARERGDAPLAASLLRTAYDVRPFDARILVELSRTHRLFGDLTASAERARQAIELDPVEPAAWFLLGSALLDLNDADGARAPLEQAVKLAPQSRDAHLYLAMVYMRLKEHENAVAALREAVRISPNDAESLAKLGRVLGELGRYAEALPILHAAVARTPGDGRVHLALVTVLWLAHDVKAAAAACDRALLVAPNLADLWLFDGYHKAAVGRFDEAKKSFRHALSIDSELNEARFAQITLVRDAIIQQDAPRLDLLLENPAGNIDERVGAGHALGDLLDSVGDYGAAWDAYDRAARLAHETLRARGRAFDAAAFDRQIDGTIARFSRDFFHTNSVLGNSSEVPVFVIGMPRSGTTLVEQILSSHPQVFGAGELHDIHDAAARLDSASSSIGWDQASISSETERYLGRLCGSSGGAKRVIDKMPDNFQWLGHIAVLFPRARIVFCRRDYRDVALSCHLQNFATRLPWTTNLVDISARIYAFDRLTSDWRAVLPLSILQVQYEDLVENLESESRRLTDFLGLDWDPACLAFHETERTVMTASQWQVRQPLFTSSIGRWRHYQPYLRTLFTGLAGLVPSEGNEDWDALAAERVAALAIGASHHRAERLEYAGAIYRAVLRRNPDDPTVLHLLGVWQLHSGEPEAAIGLLVRSLALRPDIGPVLVDLARACRAAGDPTAAVDAANRALVINSASPDALIQLGCALRSLGDTAAAIEVLPRAIEIAPASLEAWVAFATALTDRADHLAAARAWQTALQLKPDDPGLLEAYARSLTDNKRFDEALEAFREIDAAAPGQPNVRFGIAGALLNKGDLAAAADICRHALNTAPEARFWLLLANCEAISGHFELAAEAYRSALELDPGMTSAFYDLAALGARADDEAAGQSAHKVLAENASPVRDRVAAAFTLGRISDQSGACDDAFAAYALANQLLRDDRKARGFAFDRNKFRNLVTGQIAAIGAQTFAVTAEWGDPSEAPVFVVGMPRSGTSLVEQIAASHKQVFGAGERMEIFQILSALEGDKTNCPPVEWKRFDVRREAAAYVHLLQGLGGGASRIIDKQPDNILCLGQLAVLYPRARIVICRRDLRDVGLSCHFQYFRDDPLVWTNDLADCGFRARMIEQLLDHWRVVLPMPVLEIQYETLVANLESESRRLIDFLGLEWDPACLKFHETERAVMTASLWQVRQPLSVSSVGRWRRYRHHLGPLLRELEGFVPPDDID